MKKFKTKWTLMLVIAMLLTSIFGVTAIADDDWHQDDDEEIYTGESCGYLTPVSSTVASLAVGDTMNLQVQAYSCNGDNWVQWGGGDDIVRINGDGECVEIVAINPGQTQLCASLYVNGNITDQDIFTVYVSNDHVEVTGIKLGTEYAQMMVGNSAKLSYKVYPENAGNKKVKFSSNNKNVARVDNAGNVFAVNPGKAVIYATTVDNNITAACTVDVIGQSYYTPVTGVVVNPSSASVGVNQRFKITATVFPVNATNGNVSFRSTNPSIATVDASGTVAGVSAGSVTIICTTNESGFSAYTQVTVLNGVAGASTSVDTRDPLFLFDVVSKVVNAGKNGTVTIQALNPMSYDSNVAAALAQRSDVTLVAVFPYNNGYYSMTLPAGYNLSARLDSSGFVEWINLAKAKGVVLKKIQ